MNVRGAVIAATLALTAVSLPVYAANLVQDGGFESASNDGPSSFKLFTTGQSLDGSWTVTGGVVGIDNTDKYVFDGNQSLFLTQGAGINSVSQTLSTTPGTTYDISFWANTDDPINAFALDFGGFQAANSPTSIAQNAPPWQPSDWSEYTATAKATSSSSVLELEGFTFGSGANITMEIDDVSVTAVPEASSMISLAFLLAGGGLLALRTRRKPLAR